MKVQVNKITTFLQLFNFDGKKTELSFRKMKGHSLNLPTSAYEFPETIHKQTNKKRKIHKKNAQEQERFDIPV